MLLRVCVCLCVLCKCVWECVGCDSLRGVVWFVACLRIMVVCDCVCLCVCVRLRVRFCVMLYGLRECEYDVSKHAIC